MVTLGYRDPPPQYGYPNIVPQSYEEHLDRALHETDDWRKKIVHGGFGFRDRNEPGRDLLDFAVAHDLGILNSFFRKRDSNLITFTSGGRNTQIDYILMRQQDRRRWRDCKVIPRETAAAQHHLLVADVVLREKVTTMERKGRSMIRWGNLKGTNITMFKDMVISTTTIDLVGDANQMWEDMAASITQVANETLGVTAGRTTGN
ncbi:uncharacterized protein LOC143562019 [Bidens hawaiensis]|uniref:uncharacterized protein LOC143562019 n=1 Tax=Bidens hawaiensis TaxID=980011 RepID=UPI00404AE4FC